MRKLISIIFILTIIGFVGCATGAERAAEADADFKEEKVKILQKYQDCVDQHKGDTKMPQSCEYYLNAIDVIRNGRLGNLPKDAPAGSHMAYLTCSIISMAHQPGRPRERHISVSKYGPSPAGCQGLRSLEIPNRKRNAGDYR